MAPTPLPRDPPKILLPQKIAVDKGDFFCYIIVAGSWWLVAGGWWLVAGGWWLVRPGAGGNSGPARK
ncbi:MAG: hypothetical protein C4524_11075 [Candidatus Zixiibacteriota bacterium]|nr:MAG: hypothetical protein C4524_11075 [candidate division Zixibacteria bacterium]